MLLDNKGWEQALREATKKSSLRIPGEKNKDGKKQIAIHGDRNFATITMTEAGVHANMQTDAAAFEAWALALLFHCGVQKIEIALDGGPNALADADRHFQRFLYRLIHLQALFPGRIVAHKGLLGRSWALTVADGELSACPSEWGKLYLNQPLYPPVVAHPPDPSNPRPPSEADLERALEVSDGFRSALGLGKLMRQWPVGLFRGKVADGEHRIFTGGKSAIDLIGVRGDELVLVELKKADNRKAGALSELFFYSCLMRDVLLDNFEFEDKPLRNDCKVTREDIKNCNTIAAIVLAPKFHPLIEDPTIISGLNEAMKARWTRFPVTFRKLDLPEQVNGSFAFG